jgi:hypothetical protein
MTKRFAVAWDTGAIAAVYVAAVGLAYLLERRAQEEVTLTTPETGLVASTTKDAYSQPNG